MITLLFMNETIHLKWNHLEIVLFNKIFSTFEITTFLPTKIIFYNSKLAVTGIKMFYLPGNLPQIWSNLDFLFFNNSQRAGPWSSRHRLPFLHIPFTLIRIYSWSSLNSHKYIVIHSIKNRIKSLLQFLYITFSYKDLPPLGMCFLYEEIDLGMNFHSTYCTANWDVQNTTFVKNKIILKAFIVFTFFEPV